jgi:hypothetical protein
MKTIIACVLVLASMADAKKRGDTMGSGIAKTTYSGSQAIEGVNFNEKYLPVYNSDDSCEDNICDCTIDDVDYIVEQGRCQLNIDTSTTSTGPPNEGFGLHLVNCSTNGQPGGMTTAEVEAEFATKLGDMSTFDSFMDYNAALLTSDLDSYVTTFDSDGINYMPIEFLDQDETYYGMMYLVPDSHMILEVVQQNSTTTSKIASHPKLVKFNEPRVPHATLKRAGAEIKERLAARKDTSTGDIMVALTVGRAASDMDAIDEFYTNGMQTTTTLSYQDDSVVKRCYLWEKQGATVDVCFSKRDDNATSTDFKVADFENMLKTVHANVIAGKDTASYGCNNKWMDNHYAIDSVGSGFDYIVEYLDATEGFYVYCDVAGFHYMTDPTGWGIQVDMQFTTQPQACSSRRRRLQPPPPDDNLPDDAMPPPPFGDDDFLPPHMDDDNFCPCTGMIECAASGSA